MDPSQEESGERLKFERGRLRLHIPEASAIAGVAPSTYKRWEKGTPIPSNALNRLSDAGYDVMYIITGVTEWGGLPPSLKTRQAVPPQDSKVIRGSHLDETAPDGFTLIPVYNVKVSAGGGALNHHTEVVQHLAFRTDWVAGTLDRDPAQLVVVEVAGDSMAPTLNEDDTLLVDRTAHQLTDGIYVLDIHDRMMVKRVQMLADGSVRLMSDNPAYSAEEVRDQELEHLVVVGRVVWIGRRI